MNKLLERQINKYITAATPLPAEIHQLLSVISESYDHHARERKMLERSIKLTSDELIELNNQLQKEAAILRIKEQHLNASQHIAHIGSWEYDGVTGNLQWSDETYQIFGLEPREIPVSLELFYSHVYPDDLEDLKTTINKAVETRTGYTLIHRIKNGKTVYERGETTFDEAGNPLKMVGTIQDITERVRADQELHKAHTELKTLFENMSEVFFSVDLVTNELIQMSNACETIYGRSVEEFRQNPLLWYDVVHEEDKKVIEENYAVMNQGKSFAHEHRIFHKDGSLRWLETRISPTLNEEGKLIRIDGITSDITSRMEAEIEIRNSEYKFRSLIENSDDAIMIVNKKSEMTFVSDSYTRIMGYSIEEIMGTKSFQQVYKEDQSLLKHHLHEVLRNPGKPITITYRRIRKDGKIIWCEGIATNLLHKTEVNGIIVNFRDITERVNYENALKYSERKLKGLIENSSEAIILVDRQLMITYASDSLYRVAGYFPEDVVGLPLLALAHPDEKEMISSFMDDVINHPGELKRMTYKTRKKDGSYIWCERVTINLLDDPAIKGIVSNFMDITERREQEEALKISNKELKKRNEELDRFVYSVSHDLRAPLTSILGLIEISGFCTSVDEVMENLNMMKQSVDRLDTFIQDILNYSKNTRIEVKKDKIDFEAILEEITYNLKFLNVDTPAIELRKNITANFDFYSDSYRISVIMNNLISNAIKYSSPDISHPVIEISILLDEDKASLIIKDNGIGIEEESQSRIFEMFFRATSTAMGSGLGLYIVKEALKKLQGTISFHSEPGRGTTFFITLPNLVFPCSTFYVENQRIRRQFFGVKKRCSSIDYHKGSGD